MHVDGGEGVGGLTGVKDSMIFSRLPYIDQHYILNKVVVCIPFNESMDIEQILQERDKSFFINAGPSSTKLV